HRALEQVVSARHVLQLGWKYPIVGVKGPFGPARILLDATLDETRDGALRAADRAVQQDHAAFGAVAFGRALEHVHETHERDVEAEDGVAPAVVLVLEEVVADEPLLVVDVLFLPVGQDHVVNALEGRAGDRGVLAHQRQVVLEAAGPVQLGILLAVLHSGDLADQWWRISGRRIWCLAGRGIRQGHRAISFAKREEHEEGGTTKTGENDYRGTAPG